MNNVTLQLEEMQRKIWSACFDDGMFLGEKFFAHKFNDRIHIEFYGSNWGDSFQYLLPFISQPEIANQLKTLVIKGPDEGANGTRNWDFTTLLNYPAIFPNLKTLFIEPTELGHHNQTIIGESYDEDGQIGKLVRKTPNLVSLVVPSAPDKSFFSAAPISLRELRVESGYNHQDFILNLSQCDSLPNLKFLDFGDYNQTYIENYRDSCTPFDHYVALFESKPFEAVSFFRLRNSSLTSEQLNSLKQMRKDTPFQFQVITTSECYVA